MSRLNPGELEIDLFCKGLRIDASCRLDRDARLFSRTRAGLGSGLELVIPGDLKDIWMNAPVEEDFCALSPYLVRWSEAGGYQVIDTRSDEDYEVHIPPTPAWYERTTSTGVPMSKIGVLQGTYLGIYVSEACMFWNPEENANCAFCTSGVNVGVNEVTRKRVADVVEVARAAKEESGVTFTHFNAGYQWEDKPEHTRAHGLNRAAPYVKAVREQVGGFLGVQVAPVLPHDHWKYDWLIDLGADHFSFCYEFHNPDYFQSFCPGKFGHLGQDAFFRAMEYTTKLLGKGKVSGEIIAGIEPIEDTLQAIDYITSVGAFPTVCIFRPLIGADLEHLASPAAEDMQRVMEHMWRAMVRNRVPMEIIPNIEVSLIVQPGDAAYLAPRDLGWRAYRARNSVLRTLASPFVSWKLKPHPVKASATDHPNLPPRRQPTSRPGSEEAA